jgi:hypothetical protein
LNLKLFYKVKELPVLQLVKVHFIYLVAEIKCFRFLQRLRS